MCINDPNQRRFLQNFGVGDAVINTYFLQTYIHKQTQTHARAISSLVRLLEQVHSKVGLISNNHVHRVACQHETVENVSAIAYVGR